jgi:hypothetical protein
VSVANYFQWLRRLGQQINLPELTVDDQGRCVLTVGDNLLLALYYDEARDSVIIYSGLGKVAADHLPAFALQLLHANLFWQETGEATLSLEPASGVVVLARRLPAEELSYEHFEEALLRFTQAARTWQERVAALAKA